MRQCIGRLFSLFIVAKERLLLPCQLLLLYRSSTHQNILYTLHMKGNSHKMIQNPPDMIRLKSTATSNVTHAQVKRLTSVLVHIPPGAMCRREQVLKSRKCKPCCDAWFKSKRKLGKVNYSLAVSVGAEVGNL